MIIEKRNGCCSAPFQYFAKKQYIFKKKKKEKCYCYFVSVVLTTYLPIKVKEVYRKNTICKNLYFKSLITLFVWLIVFLDTCGFF